MEPLVSVAFPAYNHENYVQDTIKSIINQTYENIELIAIDDGSKDLTWQKMSEMKEECEKRFTRVLLLTQENEGVIKTVQKLKALARGEYILLLASDDMLKPKCIEKEVEFLINNPDYGLCVGDSEIIDKDGNICYWTKKKKITYDKYSAKCTTVAQWLQYKNPIKFKSDKFGRYETLYKTNYLPNGFIIRKSIYDSIEYTLEAPLEDWFLMLQISKSAKMKYIDEILYRYRWHETNTMLVNRNKVTEMQTKTRKYENKILSELDYDKQNEYVKSVIKNGITYRWRGVPFIFEILVNYQINNKKYIIFKLFNIRIYEIEKDL